MKRSISLVTLGVTGFLLSGCATVINGTSQTVTFDTDPTGAMVELATGLSCVTPCKYSLKRKDDNRVEISKEGYKTEVVYIQSRTGGAAFGNILAGGIIGGVVDGSNGASNHLYPDPVYVRLVPEGSEELAVLMKEDGTVISTVQEYNSKVAEDVLDGLEDQGLRPRGSRVEEMSTSLNEVTTGQSDE